MQYEENAHQENNEYFVGHGFDHLSSEKKSSNMTHDIDQNGKQFFTETVAACVIVVVGCVSRSR